MHKDIGNVMALYPSPVTVVGVMLEDGRANFFTTAHVSRINHDQLIISINHKHELTDAAIQKNSVLSVSLINKDLLKAADYCGIHQAATRNKSDAFVWYTDDLKLAPVLDDAPISMSCKVMDMVESGEYRNYILQPVHTYVNEDYLNENDKIDYAKAAPILFDLQMGKYYELGPAAGDCQSFGKDFDPTAREKYGIETTLHDGKRLELMCYMKSETNWGGHDYAKVFRLDEANTARLLDCLGRKMPENNDEMYDVIDEYFGHYWYSKKFESFCEKNDIHYEWATHVAYPAEFYDSGRC